MKYLLLGNQYQNLYIEDDQRLYSYRYDKEKQCWVNGGTTLNEARWGYDDSEDDCSMYRYGSSTSLLDIIEISKEEAEQFINHPIDEQYLINLLNNKR